MASPTAASSEELDLLREIVGISSPSGEEEAVSSYLVQKMSSWGFRARRDEVGNAVGEVGPEDAARSIVLLGHIDTVPGEVPIREENGQLWGRGTVDAKGPFAAFVCAARRVAEAGVLGDLRVVCIGAVEEELPGSRGAHHVTPLLRPDLCVIGEPSGWSAVTLGYKGFMLVRYEARGSVVHGAAREVGVLDRAFTFYRKVVERAERHGDGGKLFDRLDARARSVSHTSDGLYEQVELRIGLRLPSDLDPDELRRELVEYDPGAVVVIEGSAPAHRISRKGPLVAAFVRAIRGAGGEPTFKLKTGTSDMNVAGPAWGCPIVAYGPGDSALDHTPDEHVSLEEYGRGIAILTQVLASLSKG